MAERSATKDRVLRYTVMMNRHAGRIVRVIPCPFCSFVLGSGVLSLSLLLTAVLLTSGCSPGQKGPPPQRVVPVTVASVVQKDVPVQVRAIGTVEAYSVVSVKSRIAGTVAKVHFREGQEVKKGDLIFTMDPRFFEAALKHAEANLAKDLALLKNAEEEVTRYSQLIEKEYVTQEQYDQIRANAEALRAAVKADSAAVESSRVLLDYCYIRAPFDGRTGDLLVDQGNVVKENDTTLVVINQINPIYVTFSVPEHHLPEIKRHMADQKLPVQVSIPNEAKPRERGVLTFIENTVDSTTGTIRLKGTFDNKDRHLWPGQFVNALLILTTQPNAIVVSSQAVLTGQQGQYVFVVKPDSTVEARPVTVSRLLNGETVIGKGLSSGEKVVTDGQARLTPGAKVTIKAAGEGEVQHP